MRVAGALLLLLAATATADRVVLVGIREETRLRPQSFPPRVELTIDILSPERRLETRRVTIFDGKMRASLFRDPFIVPEQPGLALLVAPEGKGLRCVRLNWIKGVDMGRSFLLPTGSVGAYRSRSFHLIPGRFGLLTHRSVLSLDMRLRTVTATTVKERPLHLDPLLNRLYVARGRQILYHPFIPAKPLAGMPGKARPHLTLPDSMAPVRAALTRDGGRIAYSSDCPSLRPDARRFVLSMADDRGRLLVRRSIPDRLHDLRWLDGRRLLLTTTDGESTTIHVLTVDSKKPVSRRLDRVYLSPPEIVRADLLGLSRVG